MFIYLPTPTGFCIGREGLDLRGRIANLESVFESCFYLHVFVLFFDKTIFPPCIFGVPAVFENNTYLKVYCAPDHPTCIIKIFWQAFLKQ